MIGWGKYWEILVLVKPFKIKKYQLHSFWSILWCSPHNMPTIKEIIITIRSMNICSSHWKLLSIFDSCHVCQVKSIVNGFQSLKCLLFIDWLLVLFWQLLKLMYHAPMISVYHRIVWLNIDRLINPYIYRHAPFLNTPISAVQRWWFR